MSQHHTESFNCFFRITRVFPQPVRLGRHVTRNGLVCLAGRIGSPTRRTKETRQTEQTGLRIPFASRRFQNGWCRGILLPCSWSVDFCESSSDCVPEECHESHPGLLWAFSTVDG